MALHIEPFYHQDTSTWSYIVVDQKLSVAAIIDPVLDFDLHSGNIQYQSADLLINYIKNNELELLWILETHAHADHLTCAPYLQSQLGGQIVIGQGITQVQDHFSKFFNLNMATDGSQFDILLDNKQTLALGNHQIIAHPTPGHTNDSVSYQVDDNLFVGDTFFHPDTGTARCDFPGGDAYQLFNSLQFLISFPDHYKLWLCHDYPNQREPQAFTSVEQQKHNVHLLKAQGKPDEYVALRHARDQQLAVPRLIYPSVQVNICAGQFPQAEQNGANYLKLPLHIKKS
ncbi:MAG: MBL fold metallo-hydrolase [Kangiellaceae bacterium]|nr:MBL fold metallo-hydrolase [Kangiellaceae bacterium]